MDFIDIRGVSGTAYRFRRWPDNGAHPPIAGNFAVVTPGGTIVSLGVLDDLSRAPILLESRLRGAEQHADAVADTAGQAA
jgi:hypothetical protein